MSTRERKTAWLCLGQPDKGVFRLGLEEREGREGGCQAPERFLQMVWRPWGFLASSGKNFTGNSLVMVATLPGDGGGAEPLSWLIPYHPAQVCVDIAPTSKTRNQARRRSAHTVAGKLWSRFPCRQERWITFALPLSFCRPSLQGC